jgi:hypothetical protein
MQNETILDDVQGRVLSRPQNAIAMLKNFCKKFLIVADDSSRPGKCA